MKGFLGGPLKGFYKDAIEKYPYVLTGQPSARLCESPLTLEMALREIVP